MAIAAVGATIGCLLWAVGSVALATLFFPHAPRPRFSPQR